MRNVAGTQLPGGSVTITAADNAAVCDVLRTSPAPDGTAHPVFAFVAMQGAMGVSVDELLGLAGAVAADGPMVGSYELEQTAPLRIGEEYVVGGEIVGLERKVGRKTGPFDVLTFRLTLGVQGGDPFATSMSAWILPRRDADGA
jgi:acyl dehydratase